MTTQIPFSPSNKLSEKVLGHPPFPQSASSKVHGHLPLLVDHRAPAHHLIPYLWVHVLLRHHLTLALGHHLHLLNEVLRPQRALQGTLPVWIHLQT